MLVTPTFTGVATNRLSRAVVFSKVQPGDTIQLAWRSTSDEDVETGHPEWAIHSITVTGPDPVPESGCAVLVAVTGVALAGRRTRRMG